MLLLANFRLVGARCCRTQIGYSGAHCDCGACRGKNRVTSAEGSYAIGTAHVAWKPTCNVPGSADSLERNGMGRVGSHPRLKSRDVAIAALVTLQTNQPGSRFRLHLFAGRTVN